MKKLILLLLVTGLVTARNVYAQGGLLKKVAKSMTNELLGKTESNNADQPEPSCACSDAILILDLGGKLQLNYYELSISVSDDGSLLAKRPGADEYYIAKNGTTQGPFKEGDPRLAEFRITGNNTDDNSIDGFISRNKPYISKSGDKLLITFGGKSYGPYSQINDFKVSKSKDKFAALVIENVAVSETYGKKMDEAMKNAKSDQERMELAMQFGQQLQQNMAETGGAMNTVPKLITNIPDANYDFLKSQGEALNANIKYDDILFTTYDKVFDLQGKALFSLNNDAIGATDLFISSDNTRYASYKYGTLTLSDGKTMSDLSNPLLIKENGRISLAYYYYSPGKNAIMQCKIPF